MKIVSVLTVVATLALASTAASAGGFKYGSIGGNFGTFSNINGGSFGGAKSHSYYGGGSTSSETYIDVKAWKGYGSAGASGSTGNQSSFTGYGEAHSQSGLTASAGAGYGVGGQFGGFKKN